MIKRELKKFNTPQLLAEQITNELLTSIENKNGDNFYLAVSGGSTPKILFRLLASPEFAERILWDKLHIFWSDERCVPPDDSESNYGMTKNLLLDKVKIDKNNVHRIIGESEPKEEAKKYAEITNSIVKDKKNNLPQFDWILLGMGSDGHTASLFPNQKLEFVSGNLFGVATHPTSGQKRISMTDELINNSSRITFLVTGGEKAKTLKEIFSDNNAINKYPASRVHSINGISEWYVDEAAAELL